MSVALSSLSFGNDPSDGAIFSFPRSSSEETASGDETSLRMGIQIHVPPVLSAKAGVVNDDEALTGTSGCSAFRREKSEPEDGVSEAADKTA